MRIQLRLSLRSAVDILPLKMLCCPSDGGWRWAASKRRGCDRFKHLNVLILRNELLRFKFLSGVDFVPRAKVEFVPDLKTSTDTPVIFKLGKSDRGCSLGGGFFSKIQCWSLHGCGVAMYTGKPLEFLLPRNPVVALGHIYCNVTPVTGRGRAHDLSHDSVVDEWCVANLNHVYICIYIYICICIYIYIYVYIYVYIWSGELESTGSSRSSVSSLRQRGSNVYVLACILTCDHDCQFSLSSTSGMQMSGNFSGRQVSRPGFRCDEVGISTSTKERFGGNSLGYPLLWSVLTSDSQRLYNLYPRASHSLTRRPRPIEGSCSLGCVL